MLIFDVFFVCFFFVFGAVLSTFFFVFLLFVEKAEQDEFTAASGEFEGSGGQRNI